jgi:hypothetical protein
MTSHPETLVARVVGVKKKRLAALRAESLTRGTDWDFADPTVGVTYSETGLKKLLASLGLDAAAFRWPQEPGAPAPVSAPAPAGIGASLATGGASAEPQFPPGAPPAVNIPWEPAAAVGAQVGQLAQAEAARGTVPLRVTKVALNPHILFARPAAGGDEVRVRVRTNKNFTIGMPLRARLPAPGVEVYSLEGHCPRRRGHY